jgi:hypothetical protein
MVAKVKGVTGVIWKWSEKPFLTTEVQQSVQIANLQYGLIDRVRGLRQTH